MKTFAELRAELEAYNTRASRFEKWFEARFDTRLKAELVKARVRLRKEFDRVRAKAALGDEVYTAIFHRYAAIAKAYGEHRFAKCDEFKKLLREACAAEGLKPSDTPVKVDEVCEGSYGSQGWGARKYARGSAEQDVMELQAIGIKAEVRERIEKYTWGSLAYYEVWAWTSEPEKVPYAPSNLSLKDAVKACWKRGVNPRVYWPFLPHGYEEQEGLDYFGGEKTPVPTV